MSAPTVTFTIFPDGIDASGHKTRIIGTLTLSADYQTGGDTFDPGQLGLAVLDQLILGFGRDPNSGASLIACRQTNDTPLQASTTSTPAGKIQAFTALDAEATGNLSAFVVPFVAWGV